MQTNSRLVGIFVLLFLSHVVVDHQDGLSYVEILQHADIDRLDAVTLLQCFELQVTHFLSVYVDLAAQDYDRHVVCSILLYLPHPQLHGIK
jgi:hypothetical protein